MKRIEARYYEMECECLEALELSQMVYGSLYVLEMDLSGMILFANDLYLKKMGLTLDEVKGKDFKTFSGTMIGASVGYDNLWNRLLNGETVSGEFKQIGKYDKVIWFVATLSPLLDGIGRPYKIMQIAFEVTTAMQLSAFFRRQEF